MRFFSLFVTLFGLLFGLEAKYSYFPKSVYKNQIFPVTIFIQSRQRPTVTFENSINPPQPIIKVTKNGFFFTFYFKARGSSIKVPNFWISSEDGSLILDGKEAFVNTLKSKDNFSNVIASDLTVLDYEKRGKILKITLQATEGNLEDFIPKNLNRKKLIYLKRDGATVEASYLFELPVDYKYINFSYYNTLKNRFIDLNIDLKPSSNGISKVKELNPKDSSFTKLKKYTFGFLTLFFLIMFLIYKDKFYLILFGITFVGVVIFFAPLKRVCIKKGARVYILPIKNSTVSKIADSKGSYTIYSKYKNYYKIEYKNGVIGWVRDEDLCKD